MQFVVNCTVILSVVQPSVEVFSIRVDEPVTTLTDLLFAFVCFYAFFRVGKGVSAGKFRTYFRFYFLTLGLGALSGGLLGHAFLYGLSPHWQLVSWIFCIASAGIFAHTLVDMSRNYVRLSFSRMVMWVNLVILGAAVVYTVWTLNFSGVKYYTIFVTLAVVASFSYYIYRKTGSRGFIALLFGLGVGLVSALVFSYELGISPWFNHRDISHVLLSLSALILLKGVTLILDSHPWHT
jgi:hypothetical protein